MAGFDNESTTNTSPRTEQYKVINRKSLMCPGLDLKLGDIPESMGENTDLDLEFESPSPSIKSNGNTAKKKCHLCLNKCNTFFCEDCVEKGNFTHSTAKYPERFADKKLKFYGLTEQFNAFSKRIEELMSKRNLIIQMKNASRNCKERIGLLNLAIEEKKLNISQNEDLVKKLNNEVEDQKGRRQKSTDRINKMNRYKNHIEDRVKTKRNLLEENLVLLKKVKEDNINSLLHYIFPVNKIPKIKKNEDDSKDTLTEFSEAQQLTFLKKHWVVPDCQETEYKILDAILPVNWNYSDYLSWSSAMKSNESPSSESIYNNPANRITASLTYTSQLVAVLAYFLDVRLPKNVCYSEFCGVEMEEQQFLVKVAKLNINIIHLCLSQKVNATLLHPSSTLQNLMYIFNPETSDLGRNSPVEICPELADAMMQSFRELNFSIAEEEEDVNLDNEEWETVSNDPSFEPFTVPTHGSTSVTTIVNSQVGQSTSRPIHNPQTTSTLGGGLISSVASSLWKAATFQK